MNLDNLLNSVGQAAWASPEPLEVRRAYRQLDEEYQWRAQSPEAIRSWRTELALLADENHTQLLRRRGYEELAGCLDGKSVSTTTVDEDEMEMRRDFLVHAAAVAVGAWVLGDSGDMWSTHDRPPPAGRMDKGQVDRIESAVLTLERLFAEQGEGFSQAAVHAVLVESTPLLFAGGAERLRLRFFSVLARLHSLAGRLAFDRDSIDNARQHFGRALELAKAANNDLMVSHVLCRVGNIYLQVDAPDDALKMFQLGQIGAQETGSFLLVALICALQGWAYACLGQEDQVAKMIGRMRDELARIDPAELEKFRVKPDWMTTSPRSLSLSFDAVFEREQRRMDGATRLTLIEGTRKAS
ncbi:MAG TPA: hypothetical protein VGR06_03990 [Actinophytocola sp.]|uniref:hypothetical protein n=1 Tax=Actinophytocola sp. TaxID=1872138 RepID=UPI002DF7E8F7|nr:hypothetical protein [Actinophytocola sp.]